VLKSLYLKPSLRNPVGSCSKQQPYTPSYTGNTKAGHPYARSAPNCQRTVPRFPPRLRGAANGSTLGSDIPLWQGFFGPFGALLTSAISAYIVMNLAEIPHKNRLRCPRAYDRLNSNKYSASHAKIRMRVWFTVTM
jgi:hypothetical protein